MFLADDATYITGQAQHPNGHEILNTVALRSSLNASKADFPL